MRDVMFPSPVDELLKDHTEAASIGGIFHFSAKGYPDPWCWGITAPTQNLSIVIAGIDPAIHAESLLAQSLRAASHAGCHHGPPG
jgi:hypothetical protein